MVSDPDDLKAVFTADPDVLHPGEGARILEPIVGPTSILLLDGERHLPSASSSSPPSTASRMEALRDVVAEVAEREIDGWPRDRAQPLHPHLQQLTLAVIMRAVFGLDRRASASSASAACSPRCSSSATSPLSLLPPLQRDWACRSAPGARFSAAREAGRRARSTG